MAAYTMLHFGMCLLLSFLAFSIDALIIKRVHVPHTVKPGHIVATLANWGQDYKVDNSKHGNVSRHFSVLTSGDVITNSDISSLLGSKVDLVITSEMGSETWKDTVHLEVQNGNKILLFPQQYYSGHIFENQPPHTVVEGLENIRATIQDAPHKRIRYRLTSRNHKSFKLKKKNADGIDSMSVISREALDREQTDKHQLTIKAYTDDVTDEPTFAHVTIYIDDENDNIPEFQKSHYHVEISDSTPARTTVLRVKAIDADDSHVKYSVHPSTIFLIDPVTGDLILKSRKNLQPESYDLNVYAEDKDGQMSKPAMIHIDVKSENEEDREYRNKPHFLSYAPIIDPYLDEVSIEPRVRHKRQARPYKEFEVPESMVSELIRLSENLNERFTFKQPAPKNLEINRFTGAVRLKDGEKLDYEMQKEIDFTVIISREDSPGSRKYL